jgi:hypothetical protein
MCRCFTCFEWADQFLRRTRRRDPEVISGRVLEVWETLLSVFLSRAEVLKAGATRGVGTFPATISTDKNIKPFLSFGKKASPHGDLNKASFDTAPISS